VTRTCGGCNGLGAHWRWCPVAVGRAASLLGQWSQQAGTLGDLVGPNEYGAANHLWAAAALLRAKAEGLRDDYQRQQHG
jgi:hypothetical protein